MRSEARFVLADENDRDDAAAGVVAVGDLARVLGADPGRALEQVAGGARCEAGILLQPAEGERPLEWQELLLADESELVSRARVEPDRARVDDGEDAHPGHARVQG